MHAGHGRGLEDLLDRLHRRVAQLLVRHQPGDHADALRFGGVEAPRRQQQVAGHGEADVGRQDSGVGGIGDTAQQLGHPESGPVARHGDVGQHGDQEAAGLADPVDRGHHRGAAVPYGQEGQDVVPDVGCGSSPGSERPPRSPPGAKTSPVPVMISAARSGSSLTMPRPA